MLQCAPRNADFFSYGPLALPVLLTQHGRKRRGLVGQIDAFLFFLQHVFDKIMALSQHTSLISGRNDDQGPTGLPTDGFLHP